MITQDAPRNTEKRQRTGAIQDSFPLFAMKAEDQNVHWFVELLRAGGWMTRKMVLQAAGRARSSYNERWVRRLAELAGSQIVKGQKGFNHFDNCTIEEINHAANQARAQARKELGYYVGLKRRAHKRLTTDVHG